MPEIQEVLPKYLQIANYIRDEILKGNMTTGPLTGGELGVRDHLAAIPGFRPGSRHR